MRRSSSVRWLLVLVVAAGCVRPDLVDCGELTCAADQVCHDQRCLDPSLLAQCEAAADTTDCDALGALGHCRAGVCEVATCGDGVVDVPLREECESTVASPEHCVDLGYDIGRPGCTACETDPDIGCTRFGWDRLIDEATTGLWADGTTLAYLTVSRLVVRTPTGTVSVDGAFTSVTGNGSTVIAVDIARMVAVTNGTSMMVPLPNGVTNIVRARVADDGRIYMLSNCVVYVRTGTQWSTVGRNIAPAPCTKMEIGSGTTPRVLVVADASGMTGVYPDVLELNRATDRWDEVGNTLYQVASIRLQPLPTGDVLWLLSTSGGTYRNGTQVSLGFSATTIAFTGEVAWIGDNNGRFVRYRDGQIWHLRAPGLVTTDGTDVFSYRGPVMRFRGIDYGDRPPLPGSALPVTAALDDGVQIAVLTQSQFFRPDADQDGWSSSVGPTSTMRALTGSGQNYVLSSFTDTPGARAPSLLETTAGLGPFSWIPVDVPTAPVVRGLWRAPDATLFAVGDDDAGTAVFGVRRGAAWTMHTLPGCSARAVDGTDATHVVAVGACGDQAVVWTYDGTAWIELARPALQGALAAVDRLADGTIAAVGIAGAAWFDGTAWSVDANAVGESVSATALDDIWIAGTFTSVQHFDGTAWSRVAVTGNGPIAVLARRDRVLFPGATDGFVELVR